MATENRIDFKVGVTSDGLAPLASDLEKVETKTEALGESAAQAGTQLDNLGEAAT